MLFGWRGCVEAVLPVSVSMQHTEDTLEYGNKLTDSSDPLGRCGRQITNSKSSCSGQYR